MSNQLKVVFIGNGNTGKTQVCKALLKSKFDTRYVPTLGVEVHQCKVGDQVLNVWDCAGQDRNVGLGDGYYIEADVAVVFHTTSPCENPDKERLAKHWLRDHRYWARDFKRVNGDKPIVHVFGKSDLITREEREFLKKKFPNAIFVSGKTGEGIEDLGQEIVSRHTQ